jgi:hypothetical protein
MKLPPRRTLLLTFLIGAVAGAGVMAWASPGEGLVSSQAASQPTAPAAVQALGSAAPAAASAVAAVAASAAPERCPPAPAPQALPSVGVAPTPQAPAPAAPTAVVPVKLSTEHAAMVAPPPADAKPLTLSDLHAQLLGEPKDVAWATTMEQNFRQFLAAGNQSGEFDVPTVECRQSVCEVMAFGNQPGSIERWNQLWREAGKQPWMGEFGSHVSSHMTVNDRHIIAVIMRRKPAQPR